MEKIQVERKNLQFYSTQDIGIHEINAVIDVLKSDFLSNGPKIEQFETKLENACLRILQFLRGYGEKVM